jgi:hypothetical protein
VGALAQHGKRNDCLEIVQAQKAAWRETREAELGAKQAALPSKRYGAIVADPEWRFEPWSRQTGRDRAADNHYDQRHREHRC